jgi:hypothetical protein
VQVKQDDPFLLLVLHDGRSFNFCTYHFHRLLRYAPFPVIDEYRREILAKEITEKTYTSRQNLKRVIEGLMWLKMQEKTKNQK